MPLQHLLFVHLLVHKQSVRDCLCPPCRSKTDKLYLLLFQKGDCFFCRLHCSDEQEITDTDLTKLNPVYSTEPTNYFTGFSSLTTGNSIQLSWNDAAGAQLPSDYFIIAFDNNNYFLPIDGNVINNDTSLSDGYACVNVSYSASNNYTFQNLQSNKTYYFSAYSYNGSGALINYKIDGAFPQTNSYVPGALAAEPTNHVTNISNGSVTTSSVQLNWTDALPGTQTPDTPARP